MNEAPRSLAHVIKTVAEIAPFLKKYIDETVEMPTVRYLLKKMIKEASEGNGSVVTYHMDEQIMAWFKSRGFRIEEENEEETYYVIYWSED